MKFEIKHRYSGAIIFSIETDTVKLAIEAAIKSSADLSYADLSSADLSYANLRSANLRSADLSSADLRYANLSSADLRYVDLSSADLRYVDLIIFQYRKSCAYYTFDGALRIGCEFMPITEWALGYKEIGKKHYYTNDEILMYGQFIEMCLAHFKRNIKMTRAQLIEKIKSLDGVEARNKDNI